MNAESDEALGGLRMLLKELETNSLIDSSDAERVQAAILCLEASERRAEDLEAALRDIEQWTQVAFYPGPNENPHFQAGFQEAVGVAAGIVARLLAALAPQAGETPPGAQGREGVGRADR